MKTKPHKEQGLARPCTHNDLLLVSRGLQCSNCLVLVIDYGSPCEGCEKDCDECTEDLGIRTREAHANH
jgi:hypothetical protein